MTALAVTTSPQAPPSMTVVVMVVVLATVAMVVVIARSVGPGVGSWSGMVTVTGALASTIGRANAETTMPVVRNQASSLQGLLEESSLCLLAMRVGMGERR